MLLALADGRVLPACDLALQAGVKAPTASAHLARLVEGGLLEVERRGRHALYRMASPQVARALEALAALAAPAPAGSFREAKHGRALRIARSCYDHLAGQVGVAVTAALLERGALRPQRATYVLTAAGERLLVRMGVDVASARRARRAFGRPCLDWSERTHHLAGALGAAMLDAFLRDGWLRRGDATRALTVTAAGARGLARTLGIAAPRLG
jgi:hypothetical protein